MINLKIKSVGKMPPKQGGRPDDFQTEDYAADVLAPFLMPGCHVWDPAAGKGQMARRFAHHGFRVTATDIKTGVDFLDTVPLNGAPADYDVIATNGPFSIKDDFLLRCFRQPKPFALLLPVTALGEMKRGRMYREFGGIDVILPERRVEFTTPSGKYGGGWFFTAWFCRGLWPCTKQQGKPSVSTGSRIFLA